jgi:hypothetical protein
VEDIADSMRDDYLNLENVPMIEYLKNIVEIIFMMLFLRPEFYWLPKKLPFLKIGETPFYRTFAVRKITGFQAGLLYDWRQKLETLNRSRSGNADGYIGSLDLSNGLEIYAKGFPYNRFPIYLGGKASKEELCALGNRMGISPMYPYPIHRIQEIRENLDHRNFEGAETISDTLVTLPTHILLNEEDKMMIREAVKNVLRHEPGNEQPFRQGVGCH